LAEIFERGATRTTGNSVDKGVADLMSVCKSKAFPTVQVISKIVLKSNLQ
jgi:hypothetical protein